MKDNNTYGVANHLGQYIDISKTARGAKNFATRHGYRIVYIRFGGSYNIAPIAYYDETIGKWRPSPNLIRAS